MEHHHLLYSTKVGTSFHSDSDSEENTDEAESGEEHEFYEDKVNINAKTYLTQTHNILVSSLHRNWTHLESSTFYFQIKFNASYNSIEEKKTYTGEFQENVNISTIAYTGTQGISIPYNFKNIESIHLEKLIIPNRKNYLGNGNLNETVNINTILVHIEEFSKTIHGSNQELDTCYCAMTSTNIDSSLNFIEYDNLCEQDKIFRPVPLNNLNCLSLNFTDVSGTPIRYLNEYLEIKNITVDSNTSYLKITTSRYFSKHNYKEGDIVCFSHISHNVDTISNQGIINFLKKREGHRIVFLNNTDETDAVLEKLNNVFYIAKKGKLNLVTGSFEVEEGTIDYDEDKLKDITGNIINKNLQILLKFKVEIRENDFSLFNPEII